MKKQTSSYKLKIQQEAQFWGKIAKEQLDDGMIPDLRRAAKRKKVVSMWDDPQIEKIMRGKFREFIIKKASEVKGRALDLGCGMGWLSLELARNGMVVDAVDISKKRIQIAKDYLKVAPKGGNFGNVTYVVADLNKITLEEFIYDSVVVWDTLHHIPEIDRLMNQVKRALKPGGNFIVLDHIGQTKTGNIISKILYLILPTDRSLSKKLKLIREHLWKKSHHEQNNLNEDDKSPFEDVTQGEMIKAIQKKLKVKEVRTTLSFSASISCIKLKGPLKYKLIYLLKFIDDLLIKMKILKGEYIFIWAKKNKL